MVKRRPAGGGMLERDNLSKELPVMNDAVVETIEHAHWKGFESPVTSYWTDRTYLRLSGPAMKEAVSARLLIRWSHRPDADSEARLDLLNDQYEWQTVIELTGDDVRTAEQEDGNSLDWERVRQRLITAGTCLLAR
jgi:hypothetical protein